MPSPSQQFAGLYDSFGNTMADPNFTAPQLDSALYNPITGYTAPSAIQSNLLSSAALQGNFSIKDQSITIDDGGNIQNAINALGAAGGGTLYLREGTYTLRANLQIPSYITIQGAVRDKTIIDCNTSYSVQMMGANPYSTGTIAVNNNSTTVTGSGTTWTNAMVGQSIFIRMVLYTITAVGSSTSLTIGTAYFGQTVSGAVYAITTPVYTSTLRTLSITNASGKGLDIEYVSEPHLDDLSITNCGTGLYMNWTYGSLITVVSTGNGINGDLNNIAAFEIRFSVFSQSTSGVGLNMVNGFSATMIDCDISGNTTNGMSLTNTSEVNFISISCFGNGAKGIELVSGDDSIVVTGVSMISNVSDGLKITATTTNCEFIANTIQTNGGYGINVASSGDTDIVITSNAFDTNTSGAVNDLGASTIIRGNTGVTDNSLQIPFGGTGVDGALSIASGTTTLDLGSANTFIKNYTSISITGTAKLAFSNPAATGTVILLKSQGNVTITSSTVPAIDLRLMGGTGGGPGAAAGFLSAGADGSDGFGTTTYPIAGLGGTTTVTDIRTGGSGTHVSATVIGRSYNIFAGSGGGGGGQSSSSTAHGGTGGTGGGGLIIECLGALNITSTINVSGQAGTSGAAPGSGGGGSISGASGGGGQVSGTNGSAGSAGTGSGGGGGGGGGSVAIVYKTLTANSGTYTVAGGAAGSSTGTAGAAGAGGNGYSLVAVNTSFP